MRLEGVKKYYAVGILLLVGIVGIVVGSSNNGGTLGGEVQLGGTLGNFSIIDRFGGFITKPDPTNLEPGILLDGSQNVLINDAEKVGIRKGYTLFGAATTTNTPIESAFVWKTAKNTEIPIRSYGTYLEFYDSVSTTSKGWVIFDSGFGNANFSYAPWWDNSELTDRLLMANNASGTLRSWGGGIATVESFTNNSITIHSSSTIGQLGFLSSGTRSVRPASTTVDFAYTGGENTQTFTGVTPDPTTTDLREGDIVFQVPETHTIAGVNESPDAIAVLDNQVYLCDKESNRVLVSRNTSFTNYTQSSPRLPGEGATLTLNNPCIGLIPQNEEMYVTAGNDDWYRVKFEEEVLSSSAISETVNVKLLKSSALGAAQERDLIENVKNLAVFISNEKTLDQLGNIENLNTPQQRPISDPIKPTFEAEDFTGGDIQYWRNQIFSTAPANSNMYVYDVEKGFWQPPQILPCGKLSVIQGELYCHSNITAETYKLFDDISDRGAPIAAKAIFSYQNFGERARWKDFIEYYVEGYVSENTELLVTSRYDFEGFTDTLEKTIKGTNESIIYQSLPDDGLGNHILGDVSLTGDLLAVDAFTPKFRTILTFVPINFFEHTIEFSTNSEDQMWEILAHGPRIRLANQEPSSIKQ